MSSLFISRTKSHTSHWRHSDTDLRRSFKSPLRSRTSRHVIEFAKIAVRAAFGLLILMFAYSIGTSIARAEDAFETKRMHPLPAIRTAAESFVRSQAEPLTTTAGTLYLTAAEIDSRLLLNECGGDLKAAFLNTNTLSETLTTSRLTVGVRCDQGATWTVFVPVIVESEIDVLVLKKSLARDAHITTGDFDIQRRRVPGLGSAYINNLDAVRDQHLKRAVPAGTVLQTEMFTRDFIVRRGQQVTLVFASNGLAVQAPGLALADGGTADRIRVQNQTSLKVVEGVIESGNLVRVGM